MLEAECDKEDFHILGSPDFWSRSEVNFDGTSAKWLDTDFTVNDRVLTYYAVKDLSDPGKFITPSIVQNGGLYLEWFQTETRGEQIIEVVWGGFTYDIFASGIVVVSFDGTEIARGSVTSTIYNEEDLTEDQSGQNVERRLKIRALRSGVIEVVGDAGGFTFSRIDRNFDLTVDDDLLIPAGTATVTLLAGVQRIVSAPVRYASSGTGRSRLGRMVSPPPTGATFLPHTWGKGDTRTLTLQDDTGSSFAANGSRDKFYLHISLSTSNVYRSPEFYWGLMRYEGGVVNTTADESNITNNIARGATMSVEPGIGGVKLRGQLVYNGGLGLNYDQFNHPIRIEVDSKVLWEGITDAVKVEYNTDDNLTRGTFEAGDHGMLLERTINPARLAFDGIQFTTALKTCIYPSGITNTDVTPSTFPVQGNPNGVGDFGYLAEPGQSWKDAAQRLLALYAPNWIHGFRYRDGATQYYAYDPKMLDTTPAITLYPSQESYIAAGEMGTLPDSLKYYSFERSMIEPRASEVVVQGQDSAAKKAIVVLYNGSGGLDDPTTAPDSRPAGWLGYPRRYSREGRELGSVDVCIRAAEFLWNRVGKVRELAEITCPILWDGDDNPLWIGDHIELYGTGTYRIQSFQINFSPVKPVATYTLEAV
jgi:hypothetical protein